MASIGLMALPWANRFVLCSGFAVLVAAASATAQEATPGAATNLQAELSCDPTEPRRGLARLSWTLPDTSGLEQQVVVTIFKDGFDTGAVETSESLPPTQSSFDLETLHGQAVHRWRVLTTRDEGVVASETARFEGPLCVRDDVPEIPDID